METHVNAILEHRAEKSGKFEEETYNRLGRAFDPEYNIDSVLGDFIGMAEGIVQGIITKGKPPALPGDS